MFFTNYSLLFLNILLVLSTANGQRYFRKKIEKNNSPATPKLEKKALATAQLIIVEPNASTILIANTTSTILIEALFSAKSMNVVETVTTFNCNGVLISVTAPLGVATNYTVDPRLNGNCVIVADVPDNPNFSPSTPVVLPVLNPLYFEGTTETAFHTAETLPIYVRPADDAQLRINFVITCGSVVKSIPIITATKTLNYILTPDLVGDCTFTTTNVPTGYIPIDPISVTISPSIFFVTPVQNAQYNPGSAITATLTATDGNKNLIVTVELACENTLVSTLTQNIQTTFSFPPSNEIYGKCVLSLADVDGYYTEETVSVAYKSILSFNLPANGAVIPPGSDYFIQVDGTSGTSSVSVTVNGKCQVGGSFKVDVFLGVKTKFTLGEGYQGTCTLVASTSIPYFTPATTTFYAFTPLDPSQKAKIARSFVLSGRIFDLTRPYP